MIQRIQSLWLLLAATAIALMFAFPIATFHSESTGGMIYDAEYNVLVKTGEVSCSDATMDEMITAGLPAMVNTAWLLTVLTILTGVLTCIAIFMYRNRVRQMRVVAFAFLLNVILIGLILLLFVKNFQTAFDQLTATQSAMHYSLSMWLPMISILFLLLAQHGIRKDEAKVRAADRLR